MENGKRVLFIRINYEKRIITTIIIINYGFAETKNPDEDDSRTYLPPMEVTADTNAIKRMDVGQSWYFKLFTDPGDHKSLGSSRNNYSGLPVHSIVID